MRSPIAPSLLLALFAASCNCGGPVQHVTVSVTASPRSLDFGTVPVGTSVRRTFALEARGASVTVDELRIDADADPHAFFAVGAATTLEVGTPVEVAVEFRPSVVGADAALVTVVLQSAGLDDVVVAVTGNAVASLDAGFDAGASPDAGGDVDAGQESDAGLSDAGSSDAGADAGGRFDGGGCPGTEAFGAGVWADFGSVNLAELHWNGSNWTAFFYGPTAIAFGLVDAQGHTEQGSFRQLSSGYKVRAARGVTEWGVVYSTTTAVREVKFARVTDAGALVSGSQLSVGAAATDVGAAIAFNPATAEYGVMWGAGSTVGFQRFSASGARINGSDVTLSSTASHASRLGVGRSLIWASDRWVAVWVEAAGVTLEEISSSGALVGASRTVVATGAAFDPALAASSTQYAVAWQENLSSTFDTALARVNRGGGLASGSAVSLGGVGSADLVWNGSEFFVAFSVQTQPGGEQRVSIARVSAGGQVTRGPQLVTCAPGDDFFPRVSWNGQAHVVAYTRQHTPSGQATTQEGRVLLVP